MGEAAAGEYDAAFKVLVVGDSDVGKSCIVRRYVYDTFDEDSAPTVGTDFLRKLVRTSDGRRVCMMLWDTAGQERFRSLVTSYYRGVHAFFVVYDVADRQSFAHVPYWLDQIAANATLPDAIRVLVANKVDLRVDSDGADGLDAACVSRAEGVRLARDRGMVFFECSAKTRHGVQQAFQEVLLKILETPTLCSDGTVRTENSVAVDDTAQPDTAGLCSC